MPELMTGQALRDRTARSLQQDALHGHPQQVYIAGKGSGKTAPCR